MPLPPGQCPPSEREPLDQGGRRHGDPTLLEVRHDRTGNGFALVGAIGARRSSPDRGAVIGLTHGAKLEQRRNLAGMLAASDIAPGVQLEDDRLDAELVGNGFDHRARQDFVEAQRPTQVAHEGKLQGKTKSVVRTPMPPGQRQVLRRERATAQGLFTDRLAGRTARRALGGARSWAEEAGMNGRDGAATPRPRPQGLKAKYEQRPGVRPFGQVQVPIYAWGGTTA
jgi:hypothetical protein